MTQLTQMEIEVTSMPPQTKTEMDFRVRLMQELGPSLSRAGISCPEEVWRSLRGLHGEEERRNNDGRRDERLLL